MSEMSEPIEFAAHLLPFSGTTYEERVEHNRRMLLNVLDLETTVAFIGSGVSRAFGYPLWDCFTRAVIAFTSKEIGQRELPINIDSLEKATKHRLESAELMFMIGYCKQIFEQHKSKGLLEAYHKFIRKLFAPRKWKRGPRFNPFDPLLDLPIRRFATSNYDCEIEQAISAKRSIPLSEFGLDKELNSLGLCPGACRRSFTQRKESLHQLALLSLTGDSENVDMVCHCHGRFDDPDSIIATEEDYQRWYLGMQDGASLAYQQAIQLMLGSNPVLFIGYGLRDDDLLRPLRQLATIERDAMGSRPIFALLPRPEKEDDKLHHAALFDRYGLNVVTYPGAPAGAKSVLHTKALCEALGALRDDWRKAHRYWLGKPKLRTAKVPDADQEKHVEIHKNSCVPPAPLPVTPRSLLRPGVVVLQGPTGSGKSTQALKLLDIAANGREGVRKFDKAFYWNAHYANETVTAIEYVLSFFDPGGEHRGSPYERIRTCLVEQRYLLIIDGCERLLCKGGLPDSGSAYSANFRRLLHVFADRRSQSTVILAGRLWPADLDDLQVERNGMPLIRKVEARRITSRELRDIEPFNELGLDGHAFSALCSLLRGHSYGLELAYHHLKPKTTEAQGEGLCKLNDRLSDWLPDLRLREMMRIVLEDLDEEHIRGLEIQFSDGETLQGLTNEFLQRLGLFLNPICWKTVVACYEEAWKAISVREEEKTSVHAEWMDPEWMEQEEKSLQSRAKNLYDALISKGLLLEMGPQPGASRCGIEGYTLHSTARRLLFQPDQGQGDDPLPALGLSGFTSGRLGVAPDRSRCKQIGKLFDRLVDGAKSCSKEQSPSPAARQLCRDAFGLIRTRMEANTAPRWANYEKYLHYGLELIHLTKKVYPEHWSFCEHWDAQKIAEDPGAPLYAAELAWLYNDSALALSGAGRVHEACFLWEQAYEISRLLEEPTRGGGFHLEVLLSLTFNFIETGYLPAAKGYLDEAERLLQDSRDDDYVGRIQGLRGLMEHLKGNLQAACDFYDECLERLRRGHNLRAQSIFLKHKADVKIVMGECEQANLLIRSSQSLAGAGVFPELVANARISEGHRLFMQQEAARARMEYNAVLREARRIRARKLEVRALTALARLSLDQKDLQRAHDYAIQSLSLASQLGLGLRQTHSLVVLGLITLEGGQRDFGVAYLRHAKRLADKQEYWARSREAEDKLLSLDVNPDTTEYPPVSVTGMLK